MKIIRKIYRKAKCDRVIDFDELTFVDGKIGTTGTNKEFRISKFKDRSAGFFINTTTQGNFVLTPKQIIELKAFLSSGLER